MPQRKKQMGAGFWSNLWGAVKRIAPKVNDFAKDTKIVSKGLSAIGQNGLADTAASFGYGKRKQKGVGRKKGRKLKL